MVHNILGHTHCWSSVLMDQLGVPYTAYLVPETLGGNTGRDRGGCEDISTLKRETEREA